jgi:hypothetical protein
VVVNAGPPGTTITYVVDGIAYHTEGGQQQRLTIRPTSTIVYDRGGGLGEQRYALSSGVYEFESGDTGWALFKRPAAPEDTGRTLSIRIPKNELPATSGALRNNGSGLPPAIPVEGSNTDSRSESTARDARTR